MIGTTRKRWSPKPEICGSSGSVSGPTPRRPCCALLMAMKKHIVNTTNHAEDCLDGHVRVMAILSW